ncbi:MAG: VanW family protein [bacterium]|nr:VanW family protein [bacterium]
MPDLLEHKFMRKPTLFTWRRVWMLVGLLFVLGLILFGALLVQAKSYENKVAPGLHIGSVAVGGMTETELKNFLQSMNDKLLSDGLHFSFNFKGEKKPFLLQPVIVIEDNAIELMYIDIDSEVERIMNYGKDNELLFRAIEFEKMRFSKPSLKLQNITADKDKLIYEISGKLAQYEVKPANASIKINSVSPLSYEITSSSVGNVYLYDETVTKLIFAWSLLEVPDVLINNREVLPTVSESDVENIVGRLESVFDNGNISLTYKEPETKKSREWLIETSKIAEWLEVQNVSERNLAFGLNKDAVVDYLETMVALKINIESRDAKFEVDADGKVVEFQGSRAGIILDVDETYKALNQAIRDRTSHNEGIAKTVQVVTFKKEPNVNTGDANNFGIKEILGVGISDFKGSPANRIKNIKNGAKKLNGILLKPGEEFSAIKFTKPYTEAGGYLPELVIKGNEIKPEIGGGLCQIGTTLFRMAMNAGMKITQRRAHSLVVSYYNDLENGLPGTDATIYDPAPDFRFINDTGNYLLIQTYVDEENGKLYFTLWGTNDGRKGYYEPPVVEKWIPAGPTQYIETTNLSVGQKKCQHAFKGAETNFKYIRELANGEKEEIVYESYYRPLPEICLVGVPKKTENCFGENGEPLTECPVGGASESDEVPVIVE